MSYGTSIKQLYCEKIYPKATVALFDLSKPVPFALPFYACLHAMTQQKRRIFDTPALKLRIGNNRIECHEKFAYMSKDYDVKNNYYHSDGRRSKVARESDVRVGSDPIEFEGILNSITKVYPSAKVEPAVLDYAKRLDAYLGTMKKTEYDTLEETFKETIGNIQANMQARVTKLGLKILKAEVETHRSSLDTTFYEERNGTAYNFCEIVNRFDFDSTTETLVFGTTNIQINGDSGQGETLKLVQEALPLVTKIAEEELSAQYVETVKEYKETRDILNAANEKLAAFAAEATKLYELYYKTTVEELRDAQILGRVTI